MGSTQALVLVCSIPLHGADMAIACIILPVIHGVAPARESPSKCHSSVQWSPGSLALHGTLHGSIASKPVYCNGNIFLGFVERVFTRNPHSSSLFQRTSCPFPPFPLESTIILYCLGTIFVQYLLSPLSENQRNGYNHDSKATCLVHLLRAGKFAGVESAWCPIVGATSQCCLTRIQCMCVCACSIALLLHHQNLTFRKTKVTPGNSHIKTTIDWTSKTDVAYPRIPRLRPLRSRLLQAHVCHICNEFFVTLQGL